VVEKPNTQETDPGWIDDINRHIQALLATSELHGREVEARSRPDLSLEIVVDGEVFSDVESITDGAVRDLVKAAIERWQNETATALAFATLPLRRPLPFRSRGWMIGWLVVMILLFVLPPLFITPVEMATRLSLAGGGANLGGLVGIFAGRAIGQKVAPKAESKAWMLGGLLGGILGIPIGLAITVALLSVIP
jgi:hypothetical protein